MKINLRKASALIKDLQYTIIPQLIQDAQSAKSYEITTLLSVDIPKAVNTGNTYFENKVSIVEKALAALAELRLALQQANINAGINELVSTLAAKQNLLKFYQDISMCSSRGSVRSLEEIKALYTRDRNNSNKDRYSSDSLSISVNVDFEDKIDNLKKEIKTIKDEKLLGANFHNSIEITDEMKSVLEELKAI